MELFLKSPNILLFLACIYCLPLIKSEDSILEATSTWQANCSITDSSTSTLDDCALCSCTRKLQMTNILRAECVITEDVLLHIMSLLQNAWSIITGTFTARSNSDLVSQNSIPGQDANCTQMRSFTSPGFLKTSTPETFNSCEEIIFEMETLILDLTEQIRRLIDWLDDPENFNPRIAQLEECLRCVNRQLDDTIAKYEQELGDFKERFGEMQQCFTNAINNRMKEIHELELKLEFKSYQLIKSSVNASSFPTALSEFIRQNNNSMLDTIADDLYGSDKIENLLIFAFLLPQPSQRVKIFDRMKDLMQAQGHLMSMHVLSFNKVFYDDIKRICGSTPISSCTQLPEGYTNVKTLVDAVTSLVKASLVANICSSNYTAIIQVGSPESEVNLAGNSFQNILPQLIEASFRRCPDKLDYILSFVTKLRWNKQKPVAFQKLLDLVSDSERKFHIALKMKEAAENLNGPDGKQEEAKDELLKLKNNLPQPVKSLVWHSSCTLRNPTFSDKWLFTEDILQPENTRLLARSDKSKTAEWRFQPILKDNGDIHFLVENKETGEYLASSIPWRNYDINLGFTATSNTIDDEYPPRNYHWQVRYVADSNNIRLYHVGRKGYLIPSDIVYKSFNEVVLDLPNQDPVPETEWVLSCDEL